MKKIKIKNGKILALIIVILIVIVLFFTGYSIGKEIINVNVNATTQIAKPIMIVENNPAIDITSIKNTGYYDFKVKNYNDNEINQIELKYWIEIISKYDETISFKIYKDNQEIPLTDNKTQEIKLEKNEKREQNYRLEIIYDKTKSTSTEDIIQDVQIKVHSEQNEHI